MRTKLSAVLLALVLCALALPAHAQRQIFQGVGLASGLALNPGATNATQTSDLFNVTNGTNRRGFIQINVTICTTCNLTVTVVITDPDGTEWTWDNPTALTTTGVVRYFWGAKLISTAPAYDVTVTNMTGPPIVIAKPFPPQFKIRVVWNSGTTATYTVQGEAW